jgi:hypothetical protein
VTRSGYQSGFWRTDAEGIRVKGDIAPHAIYRTDADPLAVNGTARAESGEILCFSGVTTDKKICRKVLGHRTKKAGNFRLKVYVVRFNALHGDSGAPVWDSGTGSAVGLIQGGPIGDPELTYVTPLLSIPHVSVAQAPGALNAPGMYSMHVMTDD